MEEKLKVSTSQTETVEAGVSPARTQSAADASQASKTRSNEKDKLKTGLALDLNELQESSGEELEALARDLDVYLHPARSRHQHLLDIVRAALATDAPVTAEGFLDQVGDSFAMLRWPKLNLDRKSTRLNSSHSQISYAVFCLKKQNTENRESTTTI